MKTLAFARRSGPLANRILFTKGKRSRRGTGRTSEEHVEMLPSNVETAGREGGCSHSHMWSPGCVVTY